MTDFAAIANALADLSKASSEQPTRASIAMLQAQLDQLKLQIKPQKEPKNVQPQ